MFQADDSKTDTSLIEVTPVVKKTRGGRGRGRGRKTSTSAASFEDSNTENDPDAAGGSSKLSRKPRVTRTSRRNTTSKKEV